MTDRIAFAATVTSEGRGIRGSVQIAGQRVRRAGEWLEIDPAALVKADASAIVGRWEHDPHKILGRPENGTLTFTRTDQGIEYELSDIPATSYGNDALELVKGGYVTGSSFEIEGARSTSSHDPETGERIRHVHYIARITDVSPVSNPAFASSTAAAFSKESDVTDIIEEPVAAPKPIEAEKFADDVTDTTLRFARTLDADRIRSAMDNLMASTSDLRGDALKQYEAYSVVLGEKERGNAEETDRANRMKFMHDIRMGRSPKSPQVSETFASEDYKAAFNQYLRTGDKVHVERFAQAITGNGTQGGFTVPDGFLNRITESLKAYGGIAGIADSITTADGQSLRWPSNNDTANTAIIAAEGVAAAGAGADKVFGNVTLGAWSYDATGTGNVPLLVSKELIQDAAFDIESFIARNLSTRIGRKMATDFAVGVGTTEPLGLLAKTPDVMTATTMFAALVEHMFQVDQAYRETGNCRWVLSDTTLAKIYNSIDDAGRPLFIPSADSSGSGRPGGFLLGFPITLDQAAGNLVAFGDIRLGYIVRYVRGVQVDVDPYTNIKTRQVAYHAWARADANVQDSAAYSVSDYVGVSADS